MILQNMILITAIHSFIQIQYNQEFSVLVVDKTLIKGVLKI